MFLPRIIRTPDTRDQSALVMDATRQHLEVTTVSNRALPIGPRNS